jgi:hypothetical protein
MLRKGFGTGPAEKWPVLARAPMRHAATIAGFGGCGKVMGEVAMPDNFKARKEVTRGWLGASRSGYLQRAEGSAGN